MFRAVILGAPASGKGTISARIVKEFGLIHLSSGDILRKNIKDDTVIGREANNYVRDGNLVPDGVMTNLVLTELEKISLQNWLLDGFPRTRNQAEILMQKYPISLAIALEVPVEEIVNRVKGRWIHVKSGRIYNETFNKPKIPEIDDVTGEKLEQRPDDAPAAVRHRLQLYKNTVEPLLNFYKERGILQTFSGRTSDEITPLVRQSILQFVPSVN